MFHKVNSYERLRFARLCDAAVCSYVRQHCHRWRTY